MQVQWYDKNTTAILRKCTQRKQVKSELILYTFCYTVGCTRGIWKVLSMVYYLSNQCANTMHHFKELSFLFVMAQIP